MAKPLKSKMVTAESLTRKLRDRNGNPKELVSLANDLLHEKVTVYLPHKETVLMEWILDKLNQSNGTWKTNFETWKLLEYLWCTVDRETADREFSDHHLISLLAATLDTFHGQERVTPQLLEAFISFLNTLINSRGNYRASVDSEISLISSYLAFMSHSIPNYSASLAQCLEPMLTQLVNHITIRRQLSTLLSRSIDSILILLGDYQSRLPLTLETFIDSLLEASFRSDEKIDFISFLVPFKHKKETELSSHIDPSRSAMHYFQTWLKCPNRRDVAIREFPRIVQLWPTSVIGILETLVELHEVPSDDSLKEILASNKSNWKLIRLILLLNPTLILSECQGLFTALISSNEKSKSEALLLMLQLINTYSQARDFDAFFHLWKAQLDIPDSLWSQDLIVREITNHLSKLSLHLIDLLLKEILDFLGSSSGTTMLNSEYLPLFAIITSLQRFSSQSIYSELQTTLYKLFNCNYANINSDFRIWNLRYEVLSLSPSFVTLFKDSLLSQLNLEVQSNQIQSWAIAFSVVLRCREFYNLVEFDSMVKRILEVVPQHPIGLTVISDRWLVLVESLFNNENKDILVTLYFQNPTKLEELFSNDIFYEQRTFSRRIINRMQSVLSTKTHSNKEMRHAILKCIAQSPIEIFPKLARLEILDGILANLFKDIESYKDTNMALLAATNIIQWPTYSSKVENDPHIIQKLFKSFDLILARKLLSRIIEHHTVNLNNISSRKYINDLSTIIADKLNQKFSDKRIDKERPLQEEMWILEIASVMAQNSHVDIKFRENTVKGILYFLSTSTTYDERTVRLIKDLSDLMVREVASQSLREDITKVVGNLTVVNLNPDIPNLPLLENLFVVLCITTIQSSLNALPLIALALQLSKSFSLNSYLLHKTLSKL